MEKYEGWLEEDIELHKSIDWKARNYTDYAVSEDCFTSSAICYKIGKKETVSGVKFVKYIRSNPIYPPYYGPAEKPFGAGIVGAMYDGNVAENGYQIHDRYEEEKLYDMLSR